MFQSPYFYPNYLRTIPPIMPNNLMRNIGGLTRTATNGGLFSRLGQSLGFFRNINWGGFINNASKTLGVINQTIPLVKQAGPMVRNFKSVLKLASVFKDETDQITNKNNIINTKKSTTNNSTNNYNKQVNQNSNTSPNTINETNQPIFFVN